MPDRIRFAHRSRLRVTSPWPRADIIAALPWMEAVTLDAGDMLYLPPFYFHHVTALDPSLSVNMYVPAKEKQLVQKIFAFRPPISSDWFAVLRHSAVRVYLLRLVQRVWRDGDVASFRDALLRDRYNESLLRNDAVFDLPPQQAPQHSTAASPTDALDTFVDTYCQPFTGSPLELHHAADTLAHTFALLPAGVRELTLMDYVDDACLAVVPITLVRAYLEHCFQQ